VDASYEEDTFWNAVQVVGHLSQKDVSWLKEALRQEVRICWIPMALAEALSKEGYTVGIISNHSAFWFDYIVRRFHFADVFSQSSIVIPSCNVKFAKPSIDIFKIAFERLRETNRSVTDASEVLFIDDKSANVDAARKFGFRGILFSNETDDKKRLVEEVHNHVSKASLSIFSACSC